MRSDILSKHPIALKALPRSDEGDHRMPDMSAKDVREYYDAIAAYGPEVQLVFRILITTGADLGEVLSRRVSDCDLERDLPRIKYRRSKTRTPERLVPFPAVFVPELRAHIERHGLGRADLIFGMLNRGRFEWAHKVGRNAIGQPHLRVKDARHIAAINWRRAGVDIESIREWLGHATIAQTIIYNRFAPDDIYDRPAVDRAAERLLGRSGAVQLVRAG